MIMEKIEIKVDEYIVLGKSCSQAKHTTMHVLPEQNMPMANFVWVKDATQVLPRQQMPKATFSQSYITIHVYKKD